MRKKTPEAKRETKRLWRVNNREKDRASSQKYRAANPHVIRNWNALQRENVMVVRDTAKGKPCMDCGIQYPPYVMDFDHRPGETKLFAISRAPRAKESALVAEIAKCDVVCANCHRERTYRRANF